LISKKNFRPQHERRRSLSLPHQVNLDYGIHRLTALVSGLSIAQVQLAFRDILSLRDNAQAFLNGKRVMDKKTILRKDDRLEFVKWRGTKGSNEDEFFSMTSKEAAGLFGVSVETIRRWILSGRLEGTRKPLRTNLTACRELRDKQRVQQTVPAETGKPRRYSRAGRNPWQFIDPDKSGQD